jgi:anti-sigma28 factor (negative regulator of flagellin synthesis)
MAQISSLGSLPDPISNLSSALKSGLANPAQRATPASTTSAAAQSDETQASPLQAQLTRLSSVLNSLQSNAANTRAQYVQASNKVKSGTYKVDSLDVSKSIIQDLLTKQ